MNFLKNLFSATATEPIKAIGEVGDRLFTSDEERKELDIQLEEVKSKPHLMQALANITAARHRNWFVAGGRPSIMWVVALGLFFFFPVKMAVGTYIWANLSLEAGMMLDYPFDAGGLIELVSMLLGLAGFRTFEKLKGVAK